MRDVPGLFWDGIGDAARAILTGETMSDDGEAAGILLAETIIRLRQAHEPKKK